MNQGPDKSAASYLVLSGIMAGLLYSLCTLPGCVPLVLGVKEIKTAGGTRISFITGGKVGAEANGIDTVQDMRGIKPSANGLQQTQAKDTGY